MVFSNSGVNVFLVMIYAACSRGCSRCLKYYCKKPCRLPIAINYIVSMHRNNIQSNPAQEIVWAIANINSYEHLQGFFNEIFTKAELHDLGLRWEVMKRLKAGIAQRKIAQELGVSLCKITRGAKIIKDADSVTNKLLSSNVKLPVSNCQFPV